MIEPTSALIIPAAAGKVGLASTAGPILICVLILVAVARGGKPKFEMTPERRVVFDSAMRKLRDPVKLRELAQVFEELGGGDPWGGLLRKRAALRERPKDVRDAHRDVFRKTLLCKEPSVVDEIAQAFEEMGATGCAARLYAVAKGLRETPDGSEYQPTVVDALPEGTPESPEQPTQAETPTPSDTDEEAITAAKADAQKKRTTLEQEIEAARVDAAVKREQRANRKDDGHAEAS